MTARLLGSFLAVASVVVLLNLSSSADADAPKAPEKDALFFESPEKAVAQTTELLKKEDWPTLARYYDLTGTRTDPATLKSGEFFLRKEKPENAHPGLPWKYRHPFTPGYKFDSVKETDVKGVVRVTVAISIDQGGGPAQRSVSTFDMRKRDRGYQILPEQVKAEKEKKVSVGITSDVRCVARKVHSGPYLAWELRLWRVIETDNGRDSVGTYLTSVGSDPVSLSVRYKKLDSGQMYVSIDELQSAFAVETGKEMGTFLRKTEYAQIHSDEMALQVVDRYNVEVNERQFPLLPPR